MPDGVVGQSDHDVQVRTVGPEGVVEYGTGEQRPLGVRVAVAYEGSGVETLGNHASWPRDSACTWHRFPWICECAAPAGGDERAYRLSRSPVWVGGRLQCIDADNRDTQAITQTLCGAKTNPQPVECTRTYRDADGPNVAERKAVETEEMMNLRQQSCRLVSSCSPHQFVNRLAIIERKPGNLCRGVDGQ
jgi:hypothetical protein